MEDKYLPSLKRLRIKNFSLYPGDLDFRYDFINGINLIIGGNGLGKTTFLNIIKYALIGLYKKGIDVKRREYRGVEYRYDKRVNLPYTYFSNRMDQAFELNEEAEVTLAFKLNKTVFEVTRSLYEPSIKSVFVKEDGKSTEIKGHIVSQYDFDNLFSDPRKNEKELSETLQWKYESAVGKASNHEFFDNIIFLVNDILFFSESRKTIMWDTDVQNKLSSKYFIDPKLDERKEKAERDWKYHDSLARHKSEDIRAIRKIIDSISDKDSKNKEYKDLALEIEKLKKQVESLFNSLKSIQSERTQTEVRVNKLHTAKNNFSKKLDDLERNKREEEEQLFDSFFKKVTPQYYNYQKFIKHSGDCPLCNNKLPSKFLNEIKDDDSHCMMCRSNIKNTRLSSKKLDKIKDDIDEIHKEIRAKEKEIINAEETLQKHDNKFRDVSIALNNTQSELRKSEFAIQKYQNNSPEKADTEFKAMTARINELEKEKEEEQLKSKKAYAEAEKIIQLIDRQRLESREKLSRMFNRFGERFLGVQCELVYEDPGIDDKGKRYLPRIGGIERLHEEELSESQRFFIDQSFRMSSLNFFNSSSSFFMCETPDSSLDLSYEKNAAKVFLEYVKQPNELILTSNFNNSEFLEYLIQEAKSIGYINLLRIGRKSDIQSTSSELQKVSNKIEKAINAKSAK